MLMSTFWWPDSLTRLGCWRIIGGRCSRCRARCWLRLVQILVGTRLRVRSGCGCGLGLTGLPVGAAVQRGIAADVHQIRLPRHVMRPEDGGRCGAFRWPGFHGLSLAHFRLAFHFSVFSHGCMEAIDPSPKKGSHPLGRTVLSFQGGLMGISRVCPAAPLNMVEGFAISTRHFVVPCLFYYIATAFDFIFT